ncbi:hypothetical protein IFM89_038938 [Coptis chinensis]|uniref:Nucleolar protein 6 n=1 Tax=Coptis chinensis TaxID=261450 RepID=A0A835I4A1_9MAGN|nr:hypothetical protein IFM89_038938 [Coptis chinensis]
MSPQFFTTMENGDVIIPTALELKLIELLKEVQLDYNSPSITTFIENTVSTIKNSIQNIPQNLKVDASLAPGFIRDIGADKVEFTFKKPKFIEIGGSYLTQTIAKPCTSIDVFICLPKECFHEKDYLNHRYHGKRCLYLCVIKKYLSKCSGVKKIEWETFQNEGRKPILVVYPVKELVELPGFSIRLIPVATSLFDIGKLKLTRNNLHTLKQGDTCPPTPKYNTSILEDMFLVENSEYIRKVFVGWKELGEALILTKVWARQRSSIYAYDCINGFLLSVIMSFLATKLEGKHIINRSMNTLQIFRAILDFIASSKLWVRGLLLQPEGAFHEKELFPVVIVDSSSHFNLTFRLTRSGYLELQDEASLTLKCLDKCRDGGFEEVFMTKVEFPAKYDNIISLNMRGGNMVYASGYCLDNECWRTYEEKVHSLLEQGLTDRAKFIRITWRNSSSEWKIEEGFSKFGNDPLLAGILVSSSENSFRVVDIGPDADNKVETAKFRRFWGEKAELLEIQRWEDCRKHRIIWYMLQINLISLFSMAWEIQSHSVQICLGHSKFCQSAYATLEDIPLRVSSVQPLDSAFRFTSVFPPEPHPMAYEKDVSRKSPKFSPTCVQPLKVMIQLEGSGNWPMDDVAIQKTKSAFLLQIGESLQKTWGMTCIASEDDVDVLMSGYAFRLEILHERGLNMVKKQFDNVQMKRISCVDKELFIRGQHSSMINGLKPEAELKPETYPDLTLEGKPDDPKDTKGQPGLTTTLTSSMIKKKSVFLRFLSNYDWMFTPLIIDINNDLTSKDEKEINENFMLSRKNYDEIVQNMEPAMFLATTYDNASEAWTRSSPTSYELKRLVAYARSSADFLTNLILQIQSDSRKWECLFRTPLNNYDAVILIHRDKLPFPQRLLFPSDMNQGRHVAQGDPSSEFHPFMLHGNMKESLEEMKKTLMVNFDPVRCFMEDLKGEFQNTFKLWHDSLGGDAIGLTWEKPDSNKRVREETDENRDPIDILRDVGEVGKGFVRSVHLLKAPKLRN